VGCGFGGLAAARALAGAPVRVTLIDRTNHHLFQPLLYQVATAGLAAPSIAVPIRFLLRKQRNVTTLLAEVRGIDATRRQLTLDDESSLGYDYLILAAGAHHSYFGHDEWASLAPGLKTLGDALDIRRRILLAFENAERHPEHEPRRRWLTFVVVGGGPTGVELAGTLAEIARHTLANEFRHIDSREARILLVDAGDRVLSGFPESLSEKAHAQLERLGVEVWPKVAVTQIDEHGLVLADGRRQAAGTVLWAAGVSASPLGRSLDAPRDRAGRVEVREDLSVPGMDNVFVIGDLAKVATDGIPVPGVAAAAKQMGRTAGMNIRARLAGRPTRAFRYRDYGLLATIGRNSAVGVVGRIRMSGRAAWLFWLCVHLFYLIGFRNRLAVLLDWAWAYLSFQRSARIIT
jgi:NADH dehydrogenase